MKKLAITLLFAGSCLLTFAQQADQVLARVRYSFVHQRDTTKRNDPYTENMLLLIGKNESLYTSYDRINREIARQKREEEYLKAKAGGAALTIQASDHTPFKPVTITDCYFFAKENKWVTADKVMTPYLIEETAPKIPWKITKDTASFSGVFCKKAVANFKGRNWIAWYAPSLPFQSGPWKLNGLPGLIIEAYDDKKEVQFKFAGIDNVSPENTDQESFYFANTFKMKEAVKTTRPEFDKLKAAFDKDPIGFHAAASGLPRNKILVGSSTTGTVQTTINNPIELK
jgi:GLPGLI family protein